MVVLFIDTCNKELAIGLSVDDKLVYKKEYDAFKRQSEVLAKEIVECFKACNIESNSLFNTEVNTLAKVKPILIPV